MSANVSISNNAFPLPHTQTITEGDSASEFEKHVGTDLQNHVNLDTGSDWTEAVMCGLGR